MEFTGAGGFTRAGVATGLGGVTIMGGITESVGFGADTGIGKGSGAGKADSAGRGREIVTAGGMELRDSCSFANANTRSACVMGRTGAVVISGSGVGMETEGLRVSITVSEGAL